MRCFITGSSGFIGSNLIEKLRDLGHVTAGYDRRLSRMTAIPDVFTDGNLLDAGSLRTAMTDFSPDFVVHLAAKTSLKEVPPESDYYAANTVGTENLLAAIEACPSVRRCLYASTKYVCRGRTPEDERDYRPHTSYGRSKAEMEEIIRAKDGGGREWCIVRPTTVWGPGMGQHYQNFLRLIQQGRYFHIAGGTTRKHLCYVGNIVHQILRLIEAPAEKIHGRVFYLADYEPLTLKEWAEALQHALHAPSIPSLPKIVALPMAKLGDVIVAVGLKKFPFTTFRYKNLTENDICLVQPTREVCGEPPFSLNEGAILTAKLFQSGK